MPIPYHTYGRSGAMLNFSHANGYPPDAYGPLFSKLGERYQIVAMRMRPLWDGADPMHLFDWRPLAADLAQFLDELYLTRLIGVGHSMGATTTLRLALLQPERFRALILIDPVLFPPSVVYTWNLIYRLGLAYQLHPLARFTRRRRCSFESPQEMFHQYRKKTVFQRLSDEGLLAYVTAMARQSPDGSVQLCYSPEWEARIYVTGVRADMEIWDDLSSLKPPTLILRGDQTDTFRENAAHAFQHRLPSATIVSIPNTTHLVPLEAPAETAKLIIQFLDQFELTEKNLPGKETGKMEWNPQLITPLN